jgi:hypothetical protein
MSLFVALTLLFSADAQLPLRVRVGTDPLRPQVIAVVSQPVPVGQEDDWLRFVRIHPEAKTEGPPLLGTYDHGQGVLIFRPRHALERGGVYRALRRQPTPLAVDYHVPEAQAQPPAVVEHIYPSTDLLPANHLKFYLHFSKPMREGKEIFDLIRLLDGDSRPVPDAWRHTELWSNDARRLTLWIHPGRVKRGVNLREEFGPVLVPNANYTLEISANLRDATGRPLGKTIVKKFRTESELRTRPNIGDWRVTSPAAGSRQPLVLKFPRPFDRALLDRMITVTDSQGATLAGRITVAESERTWQFMPEQPWRVADYDVKVDDRLEDLSGNTPARLFDVDLEDAEPPMPRLTLTFRPRS